jgi:riboflavin kinase
MSEKYDISAEKNIAEMVWALYHLCQNIGDKKSIHISSVEFGKKLELSQQTASRRINDLENLGWIERKIEAKEQIIRITKKGADIMLTMYRNLKKILEDILIVGIVSSGMKEGAYYVAIKGYYDQFKEKLGFIPFKGTLNLELNDLNKNLLIENFDTRIPIIIEGFKDENSERTYGPVRCYECYLSRLDDQSKKINGIILKIERTHHKKNIIEILAEPYLRDYLHLKDGDKVRIELKKDSE